MELSPLMFFFKKITCWIYQYNGIYIFLFSFLFFFPSFYFWLLRAYMIQLKCQSYALEKQTLQHKRLLGPFLGGIPQIKKYRKCLNCTHMHTYIHSPKHTQSQMEQINFHSFCSKHNSTYKEKHFITGFFLSFNKKWKKKILQHLNGRIFCCSLLLVNRDALSLAVVTFFPFCFFSATFCTKNVL